MVGILEYPYKFYIQFFNIRSIKDIKIITKFNFFIGKKFRTKNEIYFYNFCNDLLCELRKKLQDDIIFAKKYGDEETYLQKKDDFYIVNTLCKIAFFKYNSIAFNFLYNVYGPVYYHFKAILYFTLKFLQYYTKYKKQVFVALPFFDLRNNKTNFYNDVKIIKNALNLYIVNYDPKNKIKIMHAFDEKNEKIKIIHANYIPTNNKINVQYAFNDKNEKIKTTHANYITQNKFQLKIENENENNDKNEKIKILYINYIIQKKFKKKIKNENENENKNKNKIIYFLNKKMDIINNNFIFFKENIQNINLKHDHIYYKNTSNVVDITTTIIQYSKFLLKKITQQIFNFKQKLYSTDIFKNFILFNSTIKQNKQEIIYIYYLNQIYFHIALTFFYFSFIIKIGFFPGHFWLLDIYDGTTSAITTFFFTTPKMIYLNFFNYINNFFFSYQNEILLTLLLFIIIGSLFNGSINAIFQSKIKKILTYNGITHLGFILLNFLQKNYLNYQNFILYFLIYTITIINIFSFLISSCESLNLKEKKYLNDFCGFHIFNSIKNFITIMSFFSFAGIPPFGGFFSKFFIFFSTFLLKYKFLLFCSLIMSIISAFPYINFIKILTFNISNLNYITFFNFYYNNIIIILTFFILFITLFLINDYYYLLEQFLLFLY